MKNYFLLCCLLAILFGCKKEAVGTDSKTSPTSNTSTPKIKTITTTSYEYIKSINSNDTICEPTGETSTTNFEYDTKGRITKINTVVKFENTTLTNTLSLNYISSSNVQLQYFSDNINIFNSQLTLDERGYVKYLKTDYIFTNNPTDYDTIYYDVDGILLLGGKNTKSNSISNGNLLQFTMNSNSLKNYICEFDITKASNFNDIGIFPFLYLNLTETYLESDFIKLYTLYNVNGDKIKDYRDVKNFMLLSGLFGKPNKNLIINIENGEIRNESICEFDLKERITKRTIITYGLLTGKLKRNKEIISYSYTD